MGCANSGVDGIQELKKLSTVTGTLKVTLTGAHIDHETSKVFSMDPYIKLRFSNQEAVSQVIKKGGK